MVPCTRCILPCKNFGLLHSGCIKWTSSYPMRWLPYTWMLVHVKHIYIIRLVKLLFLSEVACPHIESGWWVWWYSYSSIHTYQNQCGSWPSLLRSVGTWVTPASSHSWGYVSSLDSTRDKSLGILMYQSMSALLQLGKSPTSWCLEVECFQPPQGLSVELCVSSSSFSSPGLSKLQAEHGKVSSDLSF